MVRGRRTRSQTNSYRQSRADESRLGIAWGLAGSILVHLLLILLTRAMPLGESQPIAMVEHESPIVFRFAQPVAKATTDDPLQDAPFLPVERPAEVAPSQPVPFTPPAPEADPGVAISQPPGEPEIPDNESPSNAASDEAVSTLDETPPPIPELVDEVDGPRRTDGSPTADPSPRRLDLDRAVREFGEQLRGRPVTRPSESGADGAPSNVYVPQLDQLPTSGFGLGNLTFESTDFDWNDYGRQIYQAIWRAWHNRLLVTVDDFEKWSAQTRNSGLNHRAGLRFVIEGNGDVNQIRIETESGCPPLDRSAADALEEVILPPLPPGFPRDREVVHATFLAQGPVLGLRPTLRAMRRAGYF